MPYPTACPTHKATIPLKTRSSLRLPFPPTSLLKALTRLVDGKKFCFLHGAGCCPLWGLTSISFVLFWLSHCTLHGQLLCDIYIYTITLYIPVCYPNPDLRIIGMEARYVYFCLNQSLEIIALTVYQLSNAYMHMFHCIRYTNLDVYVHVSQKSVCMNHYGHKLITDPKVLHPSGCVYCALQQATIQESDRQWPCTG